MATKNSESLLDTVQTKIAELLNEFQNEAIGREQFDAIYGRYHKQLELALRVEMDDVDNESQDGSTFDIKNAKMEKAVGIDIYHHQNKCVIEKLGNYDLSPDLVNAIANNDNSSESVTKELEDEYWLVYVTGDFTTAIAVFANEVSQRQIKRLERIMQHFEAANRKLLAKAEVDNNSLAQPFLSVLKRHKP